MSAVVDKFLRYIGIDTMSIEREDEVIPSTQSQRELALLLLRELQEMGATQIEYDEEHCYVYATIPATKESEHILGFIAHMDTSPAVSGANVKPRIIKDYDGKDIVLNVDKKIIMEVEEFPELSNYVGKQLIVTDGNTLLGADDKAGVAEIMAMAEYLCQHKEIPHGEIRIGFTPDEEVGHGADYFDVKKFGADFAYTVDGGALGELEYENFNAAGAKVIIKGRSVHPGDSKNKMVNAILLAGEFQSMLPIQENPMYTELYEGFYHLDVISGTVEETTMEYIIRDHSREKFEQKKERFLKIAEYLNEKYGNGTFDVVMKDSYYNMKEVILPHFHLIDNAKAAMEEIGITPIISPIRGGTDGARLSFMGLPCPNLCTGGHNFHGRYEYICVESMEKITELLLKIVEKYSK